MRLFLLFLPLFLLLLLGCAPSPSVGYGAFVNLVAQTYGPYRLEILWDPLDSDANPTLHGGTTQPTLVSGVVDVFGVFTLARTSTRQFPLFQAVPKVPGAVFLQVDSNLIITGPRGCDAPDGNPQNGFEISNCVTSGAQAYTNRLNVRANFWAPFYGENKDFCTSGDFLSCLAADGLQIVRPNIDTFVIRGTVSPSELFFAQRVVLVGSAGIYGTERTVADVDIVKPLLLVKSSGQVCGGNWTDAYASFPYDAYTGMGPDIVLSARASINTLGRVLVKRTPYNPDAFWVEFAYADGVGTGEGYFVPQWISNTTFSISAPTVTSTQDGSTPIATAFQTYVINHTLAFWAVDSNGFVDHTVPQCFASFQYEYDAEAPPQYVSQTPPDPTNWFLQPQPAKWQSTVFGSRFCAYDEFGFLAYPWCPFGTRQGGDAFGEWTQGSGVGGAGPPARLNRTADVNYADYTLTCDAAYPPSQTFNVYNPETGNNDGATVWNRENPALDLCFAPLMVPQLVFASISPNTAAQDCARRMMRCYDPASCIVCYRERAAAFCKHGWIPYDQWCYRVFDPNTELQLAGKPDTVSGTCATLAERDSLPAGSTQPYVFTGSAYDNVFLQELGFLLPAGSPAYETVFKDGEYVCVFPQTSVLSDCVITELVYPLCRYQRGQYAVQGAYQQASSQTILLFRDGESNGTEPRGEYTRPRCGQGWTGQACETPTCQGMNLTTVFSLGGATNSSTQQFWETCYTGHGACDQYSPVRCSCFQFYGPVAYVPGFPQSNPELSNCPCCCPAAPVIGGRISVNGNVSTDTISYLVCNGADVGNCVTNTAAGGSGYCNCFPVANTDPSAAAYPFSPQFGGPACTCRVNKVLAGGVDPNYPPVTEDVCSNRGTCCPVGVTSASPQNANGGITAGGTSSEICYPNGATQPTSGCVCNNGFAGEGCAAVAPFNLVAGLPVQTSLENVAFVQLAEATLVGAVVLTVRNTNIFAGFAPFSCTPQQVWISPVAPVSSTEIYGAACTFTQVETQQLWSCPELATTFFVIAVTAETSPQCLFTAYQTYFPACGPVDNTNGFMGGFWRAPAYRQPYFYQEQNSPLFAPYGSANMPCGCAAGWGGQQCGTGASALRLSSDGTSFVHTMCGADTIPPRGQMVTSQVAGQATSSYSYCKCAPFAGTTAVGAFVGTQNGATDETFAGDACELQLILNQERDQLMLCMGHGRPIFRQLPLGDCEFNVVAYKADPLYTPYVAAPGAIVNFETHEFLGRTKLTGPLDDARSVVSISPAANTGIAPGSFLVPSGTYVVLAGVTQNIGAYCAQTTRVPVTANFATNPSPYATSPLQPVRAQATVTVWSLQQDFSTLVTVQTCDPALYANTQYASACATQNWCPQIFLRIGAIDPTLVPSTSYATEPAESTCIASAQWEEISGTSTNLAALGSFQMELECSNTVFLQQDTANATANAIQFAHLDCADFVHRQIDVGWLVLYGPTLGYTLQCGSYPITPYSYVLGSMYGAQWNQIPDLQFPLERAYWTPEHYSMTASLFNGLRTFDARGNPLDGAIVTEETLDLYLLQVFAPVLANASAVAPQPIPDLVVPGGAYIVPGQTPNTVVRLSEAGPPYSTWLAFHSNHTAWIAWDVISLRPGVYYGSGGSNPDPWLVAHFVATVWSAWALQTGLGSAQDGYTQANFGSGAVAALQAFPTLSLPGVWQSFPGFLATPSTLVTFTHVANLSLFQMWRSDGVMCGEAYNVVAGSKTVFTCSAALANTSAGTLPAYMQYLYSALDASAGFALNGTLNAALNATGSYYAQAATDDWIGVHIRSVPQDSMFTISGTGTSVSWNNAYSAFVTQFLQMDASLERTAPYTIPASNVAYQVFTESTSAQIDALVEQVVVQHRWPYNPPAANAQAAAVAAGGSTRPFDWVNSYSDRVALQNAWYTLWPPSKCTLDAQCQSFSRNGYTKCVYDEVATPYQAWYNGDPSWTTVLSIGRENGCLGYTDFGRGFWDSQVFNMAPVKGYGPASAADWLAAVAWQNAMYAIFPDYTAPILFNATAEPFASLLAAEGDALLDLLNGTMGASLPWDITTSAGICAGGGTAVVTQTFVTSNLTVFPQQDPSVLWTPTCTLLDVEGVGEFKLAVAHTTNTLVYASTNASALPATLGIVQGAPYLTSVPLNQTGVVGTLGTTCALPSAGCTVDFGWGPLALACANPALFSTTTHVDVDGFFVQTLGGAGFLTQLITET